MSATDHLKKALDDLEQIYVTKATPSFRDFERLYSAAEAVVDAAPSEFRVRVLEVVGENDELGREERATSFFATKTHQQAHALVDLWNRAGHGDPRFSYRFETIS